jgi:predicted DNA-binding transcriptional regulator AlpA
MIQGMDIPKLIRRARVEELTGRKKSTILRLIKAGKFPAPIPKEQGETSSYWLESAVIAWIEQRIQPREQKQETSKPRDAEGRYMGAQ